MSEIPTPAQREEWAEWATLSNHVTRALSSSGVLAIFSRRHRVTAYLWLLGYRPTPEQVKEEQRRQEMRS